MTHLGLYRLWKSRYTLFALLNKRAFANEICRIEPLIFSLHHCLSSAVALERPAILVRFGIPGIKILSSGSSLAKDLLPRESLHFHWVRVFI